MKRRNVLTGSVAVVTLALSGCSGTVEGVPVAEPTTGTVTGTPLSTDTSAPLPAPPQWIPTADMSVDQVMREGVADALDFWTAGGLPLAPIDASAGDTTCGLPGSPSSATSCGGGVIRWDTARLVTLTSAVPHDLQHWALAQIAAHEVGHHVEGSLLNRALTSQQREDTAECLSGVYMVQRFHDVLPAYDMGTMYSGLESQLPDLGAANADAFFDGLALDTASARDAFKTCVSAWS